MGARYGMVEGVVECRVSLLLFDMISCPLVASLFEVVHETVVSEPLD